MHSDQKAKSISSDVEKSKEESKEEVIVEPKQNETENLLIKLKEIIKELNLKEN